MNQFCEITPELRRLAAKSAECSKIDPELYTRYDVKRGLRDLNGKVCPGRTDGDLGSQFHKNCQW